MPLALFFFVIGAALGSFSLVLAWRMKSGEDWIKGRSQCDSCKKVLGPADLVPVISWISLKGRCRYCKKRISPQLLIAELGLGAVAALSYVFWPFGLSGPLDWLYFALWLVILTVLSALFWFDLTWSELPVNLMYALIVLAGVEAVAGLIATDELSLMSLVIAGVASLMCGGLFLVLYKVSKGAWVGDGDATLGFGLGLIAGTPLGVFMLIFIASILGTVVSLPLLVNRKLRLKSHIPFGPLLITAAIIVQLFGSELVNWYTKLIGL